MNRWIIFIIIIGAVSMVSVFVKIVIDPALLPGMGGVAVEEAASQKPDPIIRFTNTSEYVISPGALILHSRNFSTNFLNTGAPKAYESLAETGDPSEVISSIQGNPDIYTVFITGTIEPKATLQMTVPRSVIESRKYHGDTGDIVLSYMAMIIETNDGVVWLNSYPFYSAKNNGLQKGSVITEVLDMGTEKNAPIGSGFAAGQPDLERGDENRDNGTATTEPVRHHPQFYEVDTVSDEIVQIDINV